MDEPKETGKILKKELEHGKQENDVCPMVSEVKVKHYVRLCNDFLIVLRFFFINNEKGKNVTHVMKAI